MAKIIGLTGGIGSGKSSIMKHIETLGYVTYYTDDAAKKLMESEALISELMKRFDKYDILSNGKIDRKKLAAIVFQNPEELEILNQIVHPAVEKDFLDFVEENSEQKMIFKESAILIESGTYKKCDATILVTAPQNLRVERVMKRDNISREEVLHRMKNQMSDKEKAQYADFIITNIDLEEAYHQTEAILKQFLME
ncbi:MAG TPA: dephospho-CoA kinase [Flavobacterium sp.]|nr:dephospho-CoA kinase [Flavobacterium sp.]